MAWGTVSKAIITFNQTIYESQLNKVLCFFVKASESKINQVVDLEGRSCSLSNAPENYNYNYNGTTLSSELKQTTIYFVTNKNLTTDPSVALFNSIYDTNGITAASLSLALSSFAVNYIQSSRMIGSFNPPQMTAGSSTYTPVFSSDKAYYDNITHSIVINNMQLSKPGTVYFILTFSRKITYNKITGHTDIDIRPPVKPSGTQMLNCLDGYGENPLQCKRVMFVGNSLKSVVFSNITADSLYMVYYTIANEYPLRPILVSGVSNFTVLTTYETIAQQMMMVLLVLALVFHA
jgi:hypothetical protein